MDTLERQDMLFLEGFTEECQRKGVPHHEIADWYSLYEAKIESQENHARHED